MIKLAKLTDYAVVTLSAMVAREGTLMSAVQLAEITTLPEPTVSKVLKLLAKGGVINSVRGAHGGYRLAEMPEDITILEVIEAIEGPVALTACIDGSHDSCAIVNMCGTKGRWDLVNTAVKTALENVTLRDMTSRSVTDIRTLQASSGGRA